MRSCTTPTAELRPSKSQVQPPTANASSTPSSPRTRRSPTPAIGLGARPSTTPRDFPELLARVESLILKCEARGITYPEHAYDQAFAGDPDFAWIVGSSVTLWGVSKLPKIREEDGKERPLWVTQGGSGGTVDESLNQFGRAVDDLLAEPHLRKRVQKLTRDGTVAHRDEQHLFLVADGSALPYGVSHALALRDVEPPGTPNLPGAVTHLWLAVPFSPWLTLGHARGWTRYARSEYDDSLGSLD
jgi:hypothetical protein